MFGTLIWYVPQFLAGYGTFCICQWFLAWWCVCCSIWCSVPDPCAAVLSPSVSPFLLVVSLPLFLQVLVESYLQSASFGHTVTVQCIQCFLCPSTVGASLLVSSRFVLYCIVVTVHYFLILVKWPLSSLLQLWLVMGSVYLLRGLWCIPRIWPGQVILRSSNPNSSPCPGMVTGTTGPTCWLITPWHGPWPGSVHFGRGIMQSLLTLSCLYHHICAYSG